MDRDTITQAVSDVVSISPNRDLVDIKRSVAAILYDFHSYIVDGYLVSYTVVEPWFSTSKVLAECIILRLEAGGGIKSVLGFLEDEARKLDCVRVVVGTFLASNDAALSRLYQRYGYSLSLNQLTKEIS